MMLFLGQSKHISFQSPKAADARFFELYQPHLCFDAISAQQYVAAQILYVVGNLDVLASQRLKENA